MENFSLLNPAFLVTASGLIVGAIVWLVRLESKTNATAKRQEESEKSNTLDIAEIKSDAKDLRRIYYEHAANAKLHSNEAAEIEFRGNLERRFSNFEKALEDIGRKLNHLGGRD